MGGGNICITHTSWGKYSGIGGRAEIYDVKVGSFTNIASDCKIGLRDHIFQNFTIHDFCYLKKEFYLKNGIEDLDGYWVKIGSDVWIGANCIIMRGVEIGDGAVVAAGSIVTKSVPPYAIVGGNPARFIKWRFPEKVRKELLEIKWWNWDYSKIIEKKEGLSNLVGFDILSYKINYSRKKKQIIYADR